MPPTNSNAAHSALRDRLAEADKLSKSDARTAQRYKSVMADLQADGYLRQAASLQPQLTRTLRASGQHDAAMRAAVGDLPSSIKRSLTWDCGSDMALHKQVAATGLPVYFAHPHSPWERGSNENLNRIVREFLPTGVDIPSDPLPRRHRRRDQRPTRKIHDWRKPSEVSTELLEADASTA
ncbi:hypothetical protein GCM10010185_27230 [Saccharothrix coeruleofusca]|uniref:Integrase catalytic domain-containing protein n=1 Tax=Saccharothrix coeruleofusca TaxID=33919 RepID=A0A918EEL4_9PSEU|nr:IS30 family transposase [Saccharothrix coeruleofusca]GGP53628.1 hypothetical protein GCM10010185_27230 [Saccharothrix coeruleofusca]